MRLESTTRRSSAAGTGATYFETTPNAPQGTRYDGWVVKFSADSFTSYGVGWRPTSYPQLSGAGDTRPGGSINLRVPAACS